ncbi:MAG TPA: prepilin peptidase [Bacillota bacterium]|nr:prepilin peptidase [Bacillota bacterium]
MILVVLVLLGLCFGSFVNALVWRLHEKRNWVSERSECPHCHHILSGWDLIPVVSWLLLRGKCRYCHKPIPDTPLTELAVPALFVLSYYAWPYAFHGAGLFTFVLWLVFIVGFVVLAVYDIRWFLLPDKVIFPYIGLAVVQVLGVWLFFDGTWHQAAGSLVGAIIISGLFWALYEVSKGKWIGFGDVKLGIILGLLAGGVTHAFLLLFMASFIGMFISLPLVLMGKANRKSHLPFGPLLLAGLVLVVLFGSSLIDSYMRLLGA